jgi:hypothetical protein
VLPSDRGTDRGQSAEAAAHSETSKPEEYDAGNWTQTVTSPGLRGGLFSALTQALNRINPIRSALPRPARFPDRPSTAPPCCGEKLPVCPDAMHDHRAATYSIDQQQVGSEMTLREAAPVCATLAKAMLAKGRRKVLTGDKNVEDVLEGFDVEIGVLASGSVIALEARQDD